MTILTARILHRTQTPQTQRGASGGSNYAGAWDVDLSLYMTKLQCHAWGFVVFMENCCAFFTQGCDIATQRRGDEAYTRVHYDLA